MGGLKNIFPQINILGSLRNHRCDSLIVGVFKILQKFVLNFRGLYFMKFRIPLRVDYQVCFGDDLLL